MLVCMSGLDGYFESNKQLGFDIVTVKTQAVETKQTAQLQK